MKPNDLRAISQRILKAKTYDDLYLLCDDYKALGTYKSAIDLSISVNSNKLKLQDVLIQACDVIISGIVNNLELK